MQAKGRKVAPLVSSVIEMAMKVFAAFYLIPKLGFIGTCVTEPITWVFMTIFLITAYTIQRRKEQVA